MSGPVPVSRLCSRILARAMCCLALVACAVPATAEDIARSVEELAQLKLNPFTESINLPTNVSFGVPRI
jgi:hypothetical protein